jgi:phage shock protein B
MLGDMHELARRLEDRLDTVERLVAQENPDWKPRRMELDTQDFDPENIRRLERNR